MFIFFIIFGYTLFNVFYICLLYKSINCHFVCGLLYLNIWLTVVLISLEPSFTLVMAAEVVIDPVLQALDPSLLSFLYDPALASQYDFVYDAYATLDSDIFQPQDFVNIEKNADFVCDSVSDKVSNPSSDVGYFVSLARMDELLDALDCICFYHEVYTHWQQCKHMRPVSWKKILGNLINGSAAVFLLFFFCVLA